ncbi:MAG: tyrosine recombinase [Bacilli bacterium]|nr:tyrosine recombinase [Bacilli bacterium]
MKENVEKFLDYLKYQRNYSDYTITSYHEDLQIYENYLKREYLDYKTIKYNDLRLYLRYLKEEKKEKNSSICRNLSALRTFYNYLLTKEIISSNPFIYINGPKKEKRLPRYFEYNELEELFKVPDLKTPLGQRNRLILELLYATGMRVGELVNIKLKDINMNDETIIILGKGNKERIAHFGEYAKDIMEQYLNDGYKTLNTNNLDYLLINNIHTKLTERGVRDILDNIIKKTDISKHISPHMLRHTFATHLLNEGCDILSVQKLLGHESISATGIYTHVTTEQLKSVYYKNFPRAKMKNK